MFQLLWGTIHKINIKFVKDHLHSYYVVYSYHELRIKNFNLLKPTGYVMQQKV